MAARWHGHCILVGMELIAALIVLAMGVMLEVSRPPTEVVRVRTRPR
jgi:hypothetical protein